MKRILKLFPVALAVAALASCSNDDLLGSKNKQNGLEGGDLIVTVDPFDNENTTRGLRDANAGKMYWEVGDMMHVYDQQLYAYDRYVYNEEPVSGFYLNEESPFVDAKYALFPGEMVKRAYLDRDKMLTKADIDIPRIIEYSKDSEKLIDGKKYYACNLPMFGITNTITDENGDRILVTGLRHLTAVLKLDLTNAYGNASYIKISTGEKKLSGRFVATLNPDENERKQVKLEEIDDPAINSYTDLYLDLRKVPSENSIVYVPIIAGIDADIDGLTLEYTTSTAEDPTKITAANWTEVPGMKFPNTTFKQHNIYEGSYTFSLGATSPNQISQLLEQYKDATHDLVLDLDELLIDGSAYPKAGGYIIQMPNFEHNVTINFAKESATFVTNDGSRTLTIQNAKDAEFENTITLNVGQTKQKATTSIAVNLPTGHVVLTGNYETATALTLTAAKSVTIGDEDATITKFATATTYTQKNVEVLNIKNGATFPYAIANASGTQTKEVHVDGKGVLSITGSTENEVIEVGENGVVANGITTNSTVANTITVAGTITKGGISDSKTTTAITVENTGNVKAGGITSVAEGQDVTITIAGPVTGNVTANTGKYTNVTIEDKGKVTGNVSLENATKGTLKITSVPVKEDGTDVIVTGNVTTLGEVEVDLQGNADEELTGEGVAIKGTLTMTGANKTVKLVQGYIGTIAANVANAGSWEKKVVNLTLNNEEQGIAAFGKLTETQGAFEYTESVWNGATPKNGTYSVTTLDKALANGKGTNLPTGKVTSAIFTATQLAYYQSANATVGTLGLYNELNMKGATTEWTGIQAPNGGFVFDGYENKIKNLNLKADATTATPLGLFSTFYSNGTIQNLTIDVTAALTTANTTGVGALVGAVMQNDAVYNITNVNVTLNGVFGSESKSEEVSNVGGAIGLVTNAKELTLDKVSVKGQFGGYKNLGGMIGQIAAGDVTLKSGCKVTLTDGFVQNYDSEATMDIEYAAIGSAVGTALGGTLLVENTGDFTGFKETTHKDTNTFVSSNVATNGNFYNFDRLVNFVGYSGRNSLSADIYTTSKVSGNKWSVPTRVPASEGSIGNKTLYYFMRQHTL